MYLGHIGVYVNYFQNFPKLTELLVLKAEFLGAKFHTISSLCAFFVL